MLQLLSDNETSHEILSANSCVFLHFKYLEKLLLFGNRITGWGNDHAIFENMTSLKILDLSSNLINIINETSFPASVLSSLQIINLLANNFYYVCDQMWFVNCLRRTNVTLATVNNGFHGVHDSIVGL
jgi:Leucine-rich repeat (LRR) protein